MNAFNELTGNSDQNTWSIGCAEFDFKEMRLLSPSKVPIISAQDLKSNEASFVADPFRIKTENATYVFAEAWSPLAQRGQIAVFILNSDNHIIKSHIVLSEPFHLSYPFVFKQDNDYYMLPEAWESGQLILYKAKAFPWCWDRYKVLLEIDYADPQLILLGDIWYLFVNTDPLMNRTASVFWSESLLKDWRALPGNPIFQNNPFYARSAGRIFQYRGRFFRFSQNCSERYGKSVFVSEILNLSPSGISIKIMGEVGLKRPKWAGTGFHHMDIFFENDTCYAMFDGYT
jgi:hypothetical protein